MSPHLDDIQDDLYRRSSLAGNAAVEVDALLPVQAVPAVMADDFPEAVSDPSISLAGAWKLKGATPLPGVVSMADWPATWMHHPGAGQPQWWRADTDRSDWLTVQVPTTVQHALIEAGELPDPMWNTNTYDEIVASTEPPGWPWPFRRTRTEQQEWWFARRFTVPADWSVAEVELHFEGLDYSGSVYLNGHPLGHHEGMFGGPTHRIARSLRFDGENELVVRVDPPPLHWYGKPKGCGGYGWHYGHLITTGLWRDVTIRPVPLVDVRHLFVTTTELVPDEHALLQVQVDIENRGTTSEQLALDVLIERPDGADPIAFSGEVTVPPGHSRRAMDVPVTRPAVWWPHGYGEQPLHTATVAPRLIGSDQPQPVQLPALSTRFGIRTIEMQPLDAWPGEDHYRWQFAVNGTAMFIKGANWCWTDPLLRGEQTKYEHILELARRANIQMLRVWGAGNIEDDYFYEFCDQKGILTYQEFPLSWGPPDSPHANLAVIDQQVQAVVRRLRNHPSLVMWGGGNENLGPVGADEVLFLIGRRCRQYDSSRPYHRSDPWGGSEHNYLVYHGGEPIDVGYQRMDPALYGEFGCPSLPRRDSLLRYLPAETLDRWPPASNDGGVLMHQPQFGLFDFVKQLRYADYGPVRSWDEMIEFSQFAQGDALRFAAEMMRAAEPGRTAGFWFYKMTDLFPGNSWAVVDYYGEPKSSYYRALQVCRPTSAYLRYRQLEVGPEESFVAQLWAANDSPQPRRELTLQTLVYGKDLRVIQQSEAVPVELRPGARYQVGNIEVAGELHRGELLLVSARLMDGHGALVSDQWYWINAKQKTDQVRALEQGELRSLTEAAAPEIISLYGEHHPAPLLELPTTNLEVTVEANGSGGSIRITNLGERPAFNVCITGLDQGQGRYLEDNNFGLHPGESRRVTYSRSDDAALGEVSVHAWNADAVQPVS